MCSSNQRRMHLEWNGWLQGKTVTSVPVSTESIHIEHSVLPSVPIIDLSITFVGSWLTTSRRARDAPPRWSDCLTFESAALLIALTGLGNISERPVIPAEPWFWETISNVPLTWLHRPSAKSSIPLSVEISYLYGSPVGANRRSNRPAPPEIGEDIRTPSRVTTNGGKFMTVSGLKVPVVKSSTRRAALWPSLWAVGLISSSSESDAHGSSWSRVGLRTNNEWEKVPRFSIGGQPPCSSYEVSVPPIAEDNWLTTSLRSLSYLEGGSRQCRLCFLFVRRLRKISTKQFLWRMPSIVVRKAQTEFMLACGQFGCCMRSLEGRVQP